MVLLAVGEWARFGRQTVIYSTDQPPRTEQQGVKEREAPERIHDYWTSVDRPDRSGLDNVPWSAAFISWDIASAGVTRDCSARIPATRSMSSAWSSGRAGRGRSSSPAGRPSGRPRSATLYARHARAAAPPSTTSTAARAIAISWSR
jgi:hypothetical protein